MIFLDPPVNYPGKFKNCSHLLSDLPGEAGHAELEDFARRIGLKPEWIQHPRTDREHYDVFGARRDAAVKAGAVELDRRAAVNKRRAKSGQPPIGAPAAPASEP